MMADNSQYVFINNFYIPEKYGRVNGNYTKLFPDAIIVVYKIGSEQCIKVIPNPDYSFYVAKPNIEIVHNLDHIQRELVDEVTIKYHDFTKTIADFSGKLDQFYDIKRGRYQNYKEKLDAQRRFKDSLQMNPRLFSSDIRIEDYYKQQFVKKYGTNIGNYKLMFYDIETDGASDPEVANVPINCMSFYDNPTDTMYTYIWDQPDRWPTFKKFKQEVESGEFEQRLRQDPEMNGEFERTADKSLKLSSDFTNKNTKYVIKFFADEYEMILERYRIIHELRPDFCLAWNFSFDELTTINRLKQHIEQRHTGVNIEDILCSPAIPKEYRSWDFRLDINPKREYYNKWHVLTIPGFTQYICAMSTYANIRKGSGSETTYNLNDICLSNLSKGKLDYHGIAQNPIELPYKDFSMHVHYNIRDVWCMAHLEHKNHDVDVLMYLVELSSLSDAAKKTAIVKNKMQQYYENNGLVMGNNINALIVNKMTNYRGALVAEPKLNDALITPLFPYPSKTIRPFMCDLDLASLYPSVAIANNIYKSSLMFQIENLGVISNTNSESSIDIEECMDNFQTGHVTSWGRDYLQLPSITELVTELDKELHTLRVDPKVEDI
jgi:DNA polymerase elongation subunit (family B)